MENGSFFPLVLVGELREDPVEDSDKYLLEDPSEDATEEEEPVQTLRVVLPPMFCCGCWLLLLPA